MDRTESGYNKADRYYAEYSAVNGEMLIGKGSLVNGCLKGKTVLITGAGGGIGFEAVRCLAWLGADVIVAEVDAGKCKTAQKAIDEEFGSGRAAFFPADIGSEKDLRRLKAFTDKNYGQVDVVFNNATAVYLGEAHKVGVNAWDKSYAVNLRAPVLLLELYLPDMLKRNSGVFVFVPSSGAAPFMGAYEVFKTAQVELCNTLKAELEGTDVVAFSIGPGLVRTETAVKSIEVIAKYMGMTSEAFFDMNRQNIIDPHTAGAGFAAAVALAEHYNGQEIASIQALIDAKIVFETEPAKKEVKLDTEGAEKALLLLTAVCKTYEGQYKSWQERNLFERQWIARDFKKETGMSSDQMRSELQGISDAAGNGDFDAAAGSTKLFESLRKYYLHQLKLLEGYEKNQKIKEENKAIMNGWISELQAFADIWK